MILTIACAEDSMSEGKIQRKVLDTIDFDAIIGGVIFIADGFCSILTGHFRNMAEL